MGIAATAAATMFESACAGAVEQEVPPGENSGDLLNEAIARLASRGGGVLRLASGVYETDKPILLREGVSLVGISRASGETIIRARSAIGTPKAPRSLIEQPTGARDCALRNLTLDCNGFVTLAAWRAVAAKNLLCERVVIIGWTFGLLFISSAHDSVEGVQIIATLLRDGGKRQVYPVFLSSTVGGRPFRNLTINGLEIYGTGGNYSPENSATADQLTLQNVCHFTLQNIISRDSGENGISIVRGCRSGLLKNVEVTGADGQGCQIGGGGLVVWLDRQVSFAKGQTVVGQTSGARAAIDLIEGRRLWLSNLQTRQFDDGELLQAAGNSARVVKAEYCHDITIENFRAFNNGRNSAREKGAFADLYITHAERIKWNGIDVSNDPRTGLLINNSRSLPCLLDAKNASAGSVRRTGRVSCSPSAS